MKADWLATSIGFAAWYIPQKASKRQEPEDDSLWMKGWHGHVFPQIIHWMTLKVKKPCHCRPPSRDPILLLGMFDEVREEKAGGSMQRTGEVVCGMHQTQIGRAGQC